MVSVKVHPTKANYVDKDDARVAEFEEGLKRGIEQYKTGQVKTFTNKKEFLDHLRNL